MKHLLVTILLFFSASLYAQTPQVTARLEPDSIGIGDRFDLVIEVERDLVQVVQFPEFDLKEKIGRAHV